MVAFTVAIRIDLVTLFPAMADGFLQESVIGKAIDKGLIAFKAHDLRAYSKDKHRKVDDMPYGGGPGMLMTCQPLFDAVDALATPDCEVVYLCPDGEQLTNKLAKELAQKSHLIPFRAIMRASTSVSGTKRLPGRSRSAIMCLLMARCPPAFWSIVSAGRSPACSGRKTP